MDIHIHKICQKHFNKTVLYICENMGFHKIKNNGEWEGLKKHVPSAQVQKCRQMNAQMAITGVKMYYVAL